MSSVAFSHANCRAEIGVKQAKRIISNNTDNAGNLDVDAFQRAILVYRNNPDPETGISPARCIFGRPIKDFIPIRRDQYHPHPTWVDILDKREEALRNRHQRLQEVWSEHTKSLPPLNVGDYVRVQNQIGNMPRRWDKSGIVTEVRPFDQYVVKIDGSNRVSLRNRRFLRKYTPMFPSKRPSPLKINIELMKSSLSTPRAVITRRDSHTEDWPNSTPTPDPTFDSGHDDPDTSQQQVCTPQPKKAPLALRRLEGFNKPGLKEQ